MNPDAPDRALLDRYLTGECSVAEAESVRQWLAADAANLARFRELREIREVMGSRVTWDVAGLWQRTTEAIARVEQDGIFAQRDEPVGHIRPSGSAGGEMEDASRGGRHTIAGHRTPTFASVGRPSRWRAWSIAAAAAVVVGAGALWEALPREASAPSGSRVATLHEYSTDRGQVAELKLPDGTAVLLSAASHLRVPVDFSQSRTVYLEGEARFTVPRRGGQPFFVHAGGLITRDLSTEFGVRAYPGEAAARVVVGEGSVAVRDAAQLRASGMVLDAGDVLTRLAGETLTIERRVDVTQYLGWTRHELVFHGVPVGDVLKELRRWYDMEFEITDSSLAARKMSATLNANGVTAEVLALLAASSGMRVEYRGRTAVFSAARQGQPTSRGSTDSAN